MDKSVPAADVQPQPPFKGVPSMTSPTQTCTGRSPVTLALAACAAVLLIAIIIVALRPAPATASQVTSAGTVTALTLSTARSGLIDDGEELFLVIEGAREELLVYRMDQHKSLELQRRYLLPQLFADARGRGPARR
jgi:hypothetical protein